MKIHQYDPRDIEAFQDPIWRISNLYSIRIRDGSVIRFRPRPQQLAVIEMLFVHINRLRQILPRFSFRIPACERLIEALSNYHTVRASSTGLALDEPVH